jgi:hypothetical protein
MEACGVISILVFFSYYVIILETYGDSVWKRVGSLVN